MGEGLKRRSFEVHEDGRHLHIAVHSDNKNIVVIRYGERNNGLNKVTSIHHTEEIRGRTRAFGISGGYRKAGMSQNRPC